MKDYLEMAESVWARRERYRAERARRRKRAAAALSCLCLAALLGAGAWGAGLLSGQAEAEEKQGGHVSGYAAQAELAARRGEGDAEPPDDGVPSPDGDAPVQEEPLDTDAFALRQAEAVWGGSYLDENGRWVIWLTENTPENREKLLALYPSLAESGAIFRTGAYTLAYLTELQGDISAAMVRGELPFVTSSGVYESVNRIRVTVTTREEAELARLTALDALGGAIEIEYTDAAATKDLARGEAAPRQNG